MGPWLPGGLLRLLGGCMLEHETGDFPKLGERLRESGRPSDALTNARVQPNALPRCSAQRFRQF
jgi:hypothetical protein